MSLISITNSDTRIVPESSGSQPVPPATGPNMIEQTFDYFVIEEYRGNSAVGYVGHKLAGTILFGTPVGWAVLGVALLGGCTAQEETVQGFTRVDQDGGGDNGQPRRADGGAEVPPDTTKDTAEIQDGVKPPLDATTDEGPDDGSVADDGKAEVPDGTPPEIDASTDDGKPVDDDANGVTDATTDEGEIPDGTPPEIDASTDKGPDDGSVADDSKVEVPDGTPPEIDASTDDGKPVDDDANGVTDAAADDGEVPVADDGTAETDACTLKATMTPGPGMVVKKNASGKEHIEVTINAGETATVQFCASGEYYMCDSPATGAQQIQGGTACFTVQYKPEKDTVYDPTCTAYACNDSLFAEGLPVKVVIKPNLAPTFGKLSPTGFGVLPSGDQLFNNTNSIALSAVVGDENKDPLSVTATVYSEGKKLGSISASFDHKTYSTGPISLAPLAGLFKPKSNYCADYTADDGKGGVTKSDQFCFTTSEKGLAGWWPLNEGEGTIAKDWSGGGKNALLMNGASWIAGVSGSSVNLPVTGQFVDAPADVGNFGTGPFTLSAWTFLNGSDDTQGIIDHRTNDNGYEFYINSKASKTIHFYGTTCKTVITGPVLSLNQWHHTAVTREGKTIQLYVNGALVATGVCADNFANPAIVRMGCNVAAVCKDALKGRIDEVAISKVALSGAEILAQCKLHDPTGKTCVTP